jgi:hypothetical protein
VATNTKKKRATGKRPPARVARGTTKLPVYRQREFLWLAAAVIVVAVAAAVVATQRGGGPPSASAGLPDTPDYHSLLVDPMDSRKLVLGTHVGLYVSADGGRHWHFDALSGDDAMNLARPGGNTIWLAGHEVFKKSSDGGKTWIDVRPSGLPSLDVHGFAVDRTSGTLFAAVAGRGLYRSSDGGSSFQLASDRVGGGVMALSVAPGGRLLAADMEQGLLETGDGGKSWRRLLGAQLAGLAINPQEPRRILATGPGILLSVDGGRSWRQVLKLEHGAGPVAWAPSARGMAYVVGFDRTLYRSRDGGRTWMAVT